MPYSYQGNATVQYFEQGVYVGSRTVYCCGANDLGNSFSAYWPHTAYACPHCGEIWAREVYVYEFNYMPRIPEAWRIVTKNCPEHQGSIYLGVPLETASPELIKHMFMQLLATY